MGVGALGLAATVASFYNELPGSNNAAHAGVVGTRGRGGAGAGGGGGGGIPAMLPGPMMPSLALPAVGGRHRGGGMVPLAVAGSAPPGGGRAVAGLGIGGNPGVGGAAAAAVGGVARALQPPGMELSEALQVCARGPEKGARGEYRTFSGQLFVRRRVV